MNKRENKGERKKEGKKERKKERERGRGLYQLDVPCRMPRMRSSECANRLPLIERKSNCNKPLQTSNIFLKLNFNT